MHKGAEQLLSEIEDISREIAAYDGWKKSFLKSLESLIGDYKKKRLLYAEYERRLESLLKGKTKNDWIDYYNSYQFSLLKRMEFILSQTFEIVKDDSGFVRSPAASPKKALDKKELPVVAAKASGVFNIDNEILRLKQLLYSRYSQPELKAAVKELDINIPELKEIMEEVSGDEEAASAKAAERKRVIEMAAEQEAAVKAETSELRPVGATAARKSRFSLRLPKFQLNFLNLNLSPKEAMRELSSAKVVLSSFFRRLHFSLRVKRTKLPELKKPVPLKKRTDLISFSDISGGFEEKQEKEAPKPKKQPEKAGVFSSLKSLFASRQKKIFVDDILSMERSVNSEKKEARLAGGEAGIAFGWFSSKRLLSEITGHFSKRQEPILGETTAVPVHMKKLREMRKRLYVEERLSGFDATLLAQEAKRIKRILEVEKQEVYKGSSLGLIANVTVRKISLFLVTNFPQFFGYLYNALRAANVKVLSNTYVNIMVLVTIIMNFSIFFLLLIVFFALKYPLYQIVLRSVIFSLVAGLLCATIFYVYPFMKIRDRRRKTTTNLPFAINHMSAVSTSGVPPARMFELISTSGEYEEVGVEVKKIVDFTNIFGYDLLTAIRAVASITPSLPFKKFLEGMVSTIETGGDLVSYLRQQADEAELTYKLERQRYNETVSTYSDIYTGVLIAAPLFFIAAMALVNMLGGSLGGLGVGTVMALGAYVAIPVLNIGFIIFLQMTQPEV